MSGLKFIETTDTETGATVANDGWYPDIALDDLRAATGLDGTWDDDRLRGPVLAALVAVNADLRAWRADQTAASLAEVDGNTLNGEPVALGLYRRAVHCRARALTLQVTRDFDSTRSGHDRADALDTSIDAWMAASHEAVARILGRSGTVAELI